MLTVWTLSPELRRLRASLLLLTSEEEVATIDYDFPFDDVFQLRPAGMGQFLLVARRTLRLMPAPDASVLQNGSLLVLFQPGNVTTTRLPRVETCAAACDVGEVLLGHRCVPAPPGGYAYGLQFVPCPPGTYNPLPAASSDAACLPCPGGGVTEGSAVCTFGGGAPPPPSVEVCEARQPRLLTLMQPAIATACSGMTMAQNGSLWLACAPHTLYFFPSPDLTPTLAYTLDTQASPGALALTYDERHLVLVSASGGLWGLRLSQDGGSTRHLLVATTTTLPRAACVVRIQGDLEWLLWLQQNALYYAPFRMDTTLARGLPLLTDAGQDILLLAPALRFVPDAAVDGAPGAPVDPLCTLLVRGNTLLQFDLAHRVLLPVFTADGSVFVFPDGLLPSPTWMRWLRDGVLALGVGHAVVLVGPIATVMWGQVDLPGHVDSDRPSVARLVSPAQPVVQFGLLFLLETQGNNLVRALDPSTDYVLCAPDHYYSEEACHACPPGTHADVGASACTTCPVGEYPLAAQGECTPCLPTMLPPHASSCTPLSGTLDLAAPPVQYTLAQLVTASTVVAALPLLQVFFPGGPPPPDALLRLDLIGAFWSVADADPGPPDPGGVAVRVAPAILIPSSSSMMMTMSLLAPGRPLANTTYVDGYARLPPLYQCDSPVYRWTGDACELVNSSSTGGPCDAAVSYAWGRVCLPKRVLTCPPGFYVFDDGLGLTDNRCVPCVPCDAEQQATLPFPMECDGTTRQQPYLCAPSTMAPALPGYALVFAEAPTLTSTVLAYESCGDAPSAAWRWLPAPSGEFGLCYFRCAYGQDDAGAAGYAALQLAAGLPSAQAYPPPRVAAALGFPPQVFADAASAVCRPCAPPSTEPCPLPGYVRPTMSCAPADCVPECPNVPAHAHLLSTEGCVWICDDGYLLNQTGACVPCAPALCDLTQQRFNPVACAHGARLEDVCLPCPDYPGLAVRLPSCVYECLPNVSYPNPGDPPCLPCTSSNETTCPPGFLRDACDPTCVRACPSPPDPAAVLVPSYGNECRAQCRAGYQAIDAATGTPLLDPGDGLPPSTLVCAPCTTLSPCPICPYGTATPDCAPCPAPDCPPGTYPPPCIGGTVPVPSDGGCVLCPPLGGATRYVTACHAECIEAHYGDHCAPCASLPIPPGAPFYAYGASWNSTPATRWWPPQYDPPHLPPRLLLGSPEPTARRCWPCVPPSLQGFFAHQPHDIGCPSSSFGGGTTTRRLLSSSMEEACAPGTYRVAPTLCAPCPRNTYCADPHALAPQPCPAFHVSPPGASACDACAPGYVRSGPGTCTPEHSLVRRVDGVCPSGYQHVSPPSRCEPCPFATRYGACQPPFFAFVPAPRLTVTRNATRASSA